MNFNETRDLANRNERAQRMKAEGYRTSTVYPDRLSYYDVYKPGNFILADYTVHIGDRTCTCDDFKKQRRVCKHILFVDIMREEAQAELHMLEAMAAQQETEELPEPRPLTLVMVLEALQGRIVQDLERAEGIAAQKDIQPGTIHTMRRIRARDLQGALAIINEYWSREQVNRLDLQPAPDVERFDSGWECGKDLACDRI